MKEFIISIFEVPEAIDGDPYIRTPKEEDKSVRTNRIDRETGEIISLWEEKLRYPFKTKVQSTLYVKTNICEYKFPILLEDGAYIWNGSNIPAVFWSVLGISKSSPYGLIASKWHDNLLQFKQYSYDLAKEAREDITVAEFRALTSKMYAGLLINFGVHSAKANLMSFMVDLYQRLNSDWKKLR